MRKIIITCLIFSFLIVSPPVWAQLASPSSLKQGSPSASTNILLTKALNILMARFKAGAYRADKISGRIVTNLNKMQTSKSADATLIKLLARQKELAVSLGKLKINLAEVDLASQVLAASPSITKDFSAFKNQVLTLTKNLKDIYKVELDLVSDMKILVSPTAVVSASVVPTK